MARGVQEEAQERSRREPLTRERVVEAALQIMDSEGLEAVTMRRIGRELGVEAMSLYRHAPGGKDEILDAVTELAMSAFVMPAAGGDWREDVRAMSVEWRRLLNLHPPICQLLAERHKPLEGPATYRAMDAALGVLRRSGLSAREAAQTFNALGGYIMGFVTMEQGLMLGPDDEHAQLHETMSGVLEERGFANIGECFPYFAECSTDEQFAFGLDLIVGGIEAKLDRPALSEL